MSRYVKFIIVLLLLFIPIKVNAISKDYNDVIHEIVNQQVDESKVSIYYFYSETCPHCKKEKKFLEKIEKKYDVNIYRYEISEGDNYALLSSVKAVFKEKSTGYPYTVIGEKSFLGYAESIGTQMEKAIKSYLEMEEERPGEEDNVYKIPLLGKVNAKDTSIGLLAVVLGFIDGFNPCAMWILLFLINMLINMHNKKKMLIIGYTFLFTSALVYFLSMLGISFILNITAIEWIRSLIGLIATVIGVLNIKKYITEKNNDGCTVIDDKKRKTVFKKIKKIINEKSIALAILSVIALAISVNLVEMACSLGFPAVFSEILSINKVSSSMRIIYILIYVLLYMIDDIIVFTIAVITLNVTTKSTKYTKYVNLISGTIMIIMGVFLIFKPEWVMLNF